MSDPRPAAPYYDEPPPRPRPPNPQKGRPKRQAPLPEGLPSVIRGPDSTVVTGPLGSGNGIGWELRR